MLATVRSGAEVFLRVLQQYQSCVGLLALFCIAFWICPRGDSAGNLFGSVFFSAANARNALSQLAVPAVLATGATFVIISGGIDLSAGSALGLLNCVCAALLANARSWPVTCMTILLLGGGLGATIGAIVHWTKLQPFIVTLAAMVSLRGIAFVYTNSANISGLGGTLGWLDSTVGGLPAQDWILIFWILTAGLLLKATIFGRRVYAVGGNVEAASYAGVPIAGTRVGVYAFNGVCIGLAALFFTARNGNGQPNAGMGYELDAITAAVVGGAALTGGVGNVLGTFVGALFIVCLNIVLILQGVSYYVGQGWKGVVILIAVYLQNIGRRTT